MRLSSGNLDSHLVVWAEVVPPLANAVRFIHHLSNSQGVHQKYARNVNAGLAYVQVCIRPKTQDQAPIDRRLVNVCYTQSKTFVKLSL